jgi:hypothetical protein
MSKLPLLATVPLLALATPSSTFAPQVPPPEFTVAFFGDQGLNEDAEAVLRLVRDEGADAVLHVGDFDYERDPEAWDAQIDAILGPDFPYFASVGNHDEDTFYGAGGYQDVIEARMNRLGIPWEGDLGVRSSFHYGGIFFVLTAPDDFGDGDEVFAPYIRDTLAADDSLWSISGWHRNMTAMQVGGKDDDTGWGVYEESRRGGAIIATAHEHSYSRTHLLADMQHQVVAGTGDVLGLAADDPATPEDEGRSFVFVSGIAGRSIRNQERDGPWWASIYTSDQGAQPGALFGVFHHQGDPQLARFYFKDVAGRIVDEFLVTAGPGPPLPALAIDDVAIEEGDAGRVDAVFRVTLSLANGEDVAVDYASGGGTATPGADYLPVSGRLFFEDGVTTQTVRVPVSGDVDVEGDETFLVTLSAPDGATLGHASGIGTILDDDEPVTRARLEVSAEGSGAVSLAPPGGDYAAGTPVTLTALPAPGHAFAGWTGDLSGAANPATLVMARDLRVSARFVALAPVLEEFQTGASTGARAVSTAAPLAAVGGDLYVAAIASKPNVAVTGVSGLGLAWSPVRAQCAGRGQTGVAVWQARGQSGAAGGVGASFSGEATNAVISVSRYSGVGEIERALSGNTRGLGGACSGGDDGATYAFGLETATPRSLVYVAAAGRHRDHIPGSGYHERVQIFRGSAGSVAGLSVADRAAGEPGLVPVEGRFDGDVDWAIVAVEIPDAAPYRLNVEPSPGGSVTLDPPGGAYARGAVVTVTATPGPGFVFAGWGGDLAGSPNPGTLVLDADKSVTAVFVPQHRVTVEPTPGGAVTLDPPGGRYDPGTAVTLTAVAARGWVFAGWTADLTGQPNPASLVLDRDLVAGARFLPLSAVLEEVRTGAASNASAVATALPLAGVAGDLYLATVATKSYAGVTAVSGLGLEWTPVADQCAGRGQTGVALWQARGQPSGDGAVTASLSAPVLNAVIAVSRYVGIGTIDATGILPGNSRGVAGACSGGRDGTTYAFTLDAVAPDSLVVLAAVGRGQNHTPGPGYEERAQVFTGSGGDVAGLSVSDLRPTAPGPVAVSGSFPANVDWAVIALEIALPPATP